MAAVSDVSLVSTTSLDPDVGALGIRERCGTDERVKARVSREPPRENGVAPGLAVRERGPEPQGPDVRGDRRNSPWSLDFFFCKETSSSTEISLGPVQAHTDRSSSRRDLRGFRFFEVATRLTVRGSKTGMNSSDCV